MGRFIEKALFMCVNVNLFIHVRRSHAFGVFASPSYSELFQSDSMNTASYSELFQSDSMNTACLSASFPYQKRQLGVIYGDVCI